jgi:hypothetical protein
MPRGKKTSRTPPSRTPRPLPDYLVRYRRRAKHIAAARRILGSTAAARDDNELPLVDLLRHGRSVTRAGKLAYHESFPVFLSKARNFLS